MRLYDAHNHLHSAELRFCLPEAFAALDREGVARMVVNGTCESDWPQVVELARKHPQIIPSFGLHPWRVVDRSVDWLEKFERCLASVPSAVGEIGLDRWIPGGDPDVQESVFVPQLRMAAERDLPVSIHCLKAWGRLLEVLQKNLLPRCGFLLHSYGGSREMIEPLARLGAYFSFPGYFAWERKGRQREVFRHVPTERLLIETDAPDQLLPPELAEYSLEDPNSGKALNHPANLGAVYRFVARLIEKPVDLLASQVEQNFNRLFGRF
jgi:TatD DNase family protein